MHGDDSFNDHTDGGHTDHLDDRFHTDHADTTTHADHSDLSGPGHLDSLLRSHRTRTIGMCATAITMTVTSLRRTTTT